jgi:hypothetical protein
MTARTTVPSANQLTEMRKNTELRLRAKERKTGNAGSSFATPLYVGDMAIGTAEDGGPLLTDPIFEAEVLRVRVGDPDVGLIGVDATITSATDMTAIETITFTTYRDLALIDLEVMAIGFKNVALSDGNLYAVTAFYLDSIDMTASPVAPATTAPFGPTGYLPRAAPILSSAVGISVPTAGVHTVTFGARKANVGTADNYIIDAGTFRMNVTIYEVIG